MPVTGKNDQYSPETSYKTKKKTAGQILTHWFYIRIIPKTEGYLHHAQNTLMEKVSVLRFTQD